MRAGAVLAGDAEAAVVGCADRVDDGVIALEELVAHHVGAELDAAEEAERRVLGCLLVAPRDGLQLRMVGRDAGPDQPERGRQRVVEVDLEVLLLEQVLAGVETGGAGADDGYANRVRHRQRREPPSLGRCWAASERAPGAAPGRPAG